MEPKIRDFLMSEHGLSRDQASDVMARSEAAFPAYRAGGWNNAETARRALAQLRCYRQGEKVRCLDATNGGNFLVVGEEYTVDQTQLDNQAGLRLCLAGMAAAWEHKRFERELTTERQIGDQVWWETISGHHQSGVLKEWDNGTAIVKTVSGDKAVRCV